MTARQYYATMTMAGAGAGQRMMQGTGNGERMGRRERWLAALIQRKDQQVPCFHAVPPSLSLFPVPKTPSPHSPILPTSFRGKGKAMGQILALVIVFLVVVAIVKLVRIVPQGYEWTVETFGKYTSTLSPGLHFLVPVYQAVGRKVNMMEQVLDVPSQDVITKDNAVVRVDGVVFYQVLEASRAAYEVSNLEQASLALVMTNIRTVLGSMDLDESLSKRDEINARLLKVVDEATHPWGVKVNRIEIKDIAPPKDLVDAMARQMKAEREKRANILEAEGFKQAAILKADGEKQSTILAAEGQKEAAFREAEARERLAAAEAKATQLVSDAISSGNLNAINYFVATKYVEALKAMADSPNQKMLMLPFEASGILSSMAGIAEIGKEVLAKNASASTSR
jgi:regulator of protease activity HflC (stomatin/prohibitin superfamily)